jgi:hypothetical protein
MVLQKQQASALLPYLIDRAKERFRWSVTERFYKIKLKSHPELWAGIESYRAASKSTGAKYATLYSIYQTIMETKPRALVECGTGLTTVVMCEAILDLKKSDPSYNPSFVSLESEEFYWEHAIGLLPEKYKNLVEIKLSGLVEDVYSMFRGVRYEYIPPGPYDFVFIDGPSYKTDKGGPSFCYDLLHYIQNSDTPVYAVIDTRISTLYVLQKLLGKRLVSYSGFTRVGKVHGATKRDLAGLTEPPSKHFNWSPIDGSLKLAFKKDGKL